MRVCPLSRRDAIAAMASTVTLPLLQGCGDKPAENPGLSRAAADPEAGALAALDQIAENFLGLFPESATSLGIDVAARAALRSQLGDRSANGQKKIADQVRRDLDRASAIDDRPTVACDAHERRGRPQRVCARRSKGLRCRTATSRLAGGATRRTS